MLDFNAINDLLASAYHVSDYPVCHRQTLEWSRTRPFEGLRILDATPLFRNTLVKHRALLTAGAELLVGLTDGFPYDRSIAEHLRQAGVPIVSSADPAGEADVILDCAASFLHWKARIGRVELTRSGVEKYPGDQAVMVADSGRIKRIETCLGTGEGYFRAMESLGYADWKGRKLVIFGSGKVGTGLLTYAVEKGARPFVVTLPGTAGEKVQQWAEQVIDGRDTQAVAEVLGDAYAAVCATGQAGALSNVCEALKRSPALIANMGVEDEFGPQMPDDRVLMGKRTLNFILEEPTHLKYIDATMGLHNEGINFLLAHPDVKGTVEPPAELEDRLLDITLREGNIGRDLLKAIE